MKLLYTVIAVALVVLTIGYFYLENQTLKIPQKQILSFTDCVNAGYIVMEIYPRQCRMPDGRIFTEEIKQEQSQYFNATTDNIVVILPTPGAVTGKKFSVIGKARGTWYFEASFPVEVKDKNGNILFQGPAQAQSDWMTEDFVDFKIDINIPENYIGPATLILKKDNPSGDLERDAFVSMPIIIEY